MSSLKSLTHIPSFLSKNGSCKCYARHKINALSNNLNLKFKLTSSRLKSPTKVMRKPDLFTTVEKALLIVTRILCQGDLSFVSFFLKGVGELEHLNETGKLKNLLENFEVSHLISWDGLQSERTGCFFESVSTMCCKPYVAKNFLH